MTTKNAWRRAYQARRRRLLAAGEWRYPVDVHPVTAHINMLRSAGMSLRTIATASGLSLSTITPIAYPDSYGPGRRWVSPATADVILALTVDEVGAVSPRVDATGTRRRIEALQCMGWSQAELGRRLGVSAQALAHIKREERVTPARAARIDALYRELCMTPGPDKKTRTWAAKAGYVPPLAWDNIDDPDERPNIDGTPANDDPDPVVIDRLLTGGHVTIPIPERPPVVRELAARGLSDADIARRLDVWTETILRIRHRHNIPAAIPVDGAGLNGHNQRRAAA